MSLNDYLHEHSVIEMEGHSQQLISQTETLIKLVSPPHIHNIFEIGFNAGHSSDTFLRAKPDLCVLSCDIQARQCVVMGKSYIDSVYPSRHTLLFGDSTKVIPLLSHDNPQLTFDVIFIDGNHEYEAAMMDLLHCKQIAHPNTIVIMDDVTESCDMDSSPWAVGPTWAWNDLVRREVIQEMGHETYTSGRGMSWGIYRFPTKT